MLYLLAALVDVTMAMRYMFLASEAWDKSGSSSEYWAFAIGYIVFLSLAAWMFTRWHRDY